MSKDREADETGQPCAADIIGAPRSRRQFLASAVPGLAFTAAWPAGAAPPPAQDQVASYRHPLEDFLLRYGSEFGDLTRLS